jgi:hypothetical protein
LAGESDKSFEELLNRNEASMANLQLELDSNAADPINSSSSPGSKPVGLSDFELLRLVGQGAFGKVNS